jgi:hypothetical protein
MFLTKKQFDEQVEILKGLSTEKFYGIVEYNEEEINNWLVDYSMKNQDIEEAIHGISHDLRDLEGELFNIKINHDKMTKEGQEAVETVPITADEDNKRTTPRK